MALYRIDWDRRVAEFGRLLVGEPSARGKGLGLEATRTVLELGFGTWGLDRIHLEVIAHNGRAISIYQRCGFLPADSRGDLLLMELPGPAGCSRPVIGWHDPGSRSRTHAGQGPS